MGSNGELDAEERSMPFLGFNADMTLMELDDPLGKGKTQAKTGCCPAFLNAVKRLENIMDLFLGNPFSPVPDMDKTVIARNEKFDICLMVR